MKRTLTAIAAALAAMLVVVAAPALSAHPYQPAAVDFEMAVPAGALHAAGTQGVQSAPLRAPKRFNVVGLRWEGRVRPHVHLRARQASGRWSAWHEVAVGRGYTDAAWAGDADHVQYRLSRPVPGLRIHFVNTLGTATAADRAKTAIRRVASRGAVAAAALFSGESASAQAEQPAIVPRSGWNAKDCPPRSTAQTGEVKLAFVHHTVTLNDYTAEESPAIVLGICRFHRNSNGWNDIGYNFLVDKYGTIFEGRAGGIDRPVVGAQSEGFNSQSTGIANLGDFSDVPETPAAIQAMANLIRWKLPLEGAATDGTVRVTSAGGSTNRYPAGTAVTLNRISGHRDGNNTACPGDALYAQLPELRRLVNGTPPPAPEPATTPTRLRLAASPSVVEVPLATQLSGRLETSTGVAVGGQPVAIEALRAGSWEPVAQVTTDPNGAFGMSIAPSSTEVLRAVFGGAGDLRRSSSPRTSVRVRPDVTLKSVAKRVPIGGRVSFRGGIKPAKAQVALVVQRRSAGGGYRRVSRTYVPAGRGRFSLTVRRFRGGLYRAYARFAGDAANVAGRSPYAYFRLVPPR